MTIRRRAPQDHVAAIMGVAIRSGMWGGVWAAIPMSATATEVAQCNPDLYAELRTDYSAGKTPPEWKEIRRLPWQHIERRERLPTECSPSDQPCDSYSYLHRPYVFRFEESGRDYRGVGGDLVGTKFVANEVVPVLRESTRNPSDVTLLENANGQAYFLSTGNSLSEQDGTSSAWLTISGLDGESRAAGNNQPLPTLKLWSQHNGFQIQFEPTFILIRFDYSPIKNAGKMIYLGKILYVNL